MWVRAEKLSPRAAECGIVRGERDPNRPVRISIRRRGFEPLRMVRDISWGTHDLRLVMTRGSLVTIRVTEAAAGRPSSDSVSA